jgi:hypothetical protein
MRRIRRIFLSHHKLLPRLDEIRNFLFSEKAHSMLEARLQFVVTHKIVDSHLTGMAARGIPGGFAGFCPPAIGFKWRDFLE